MIVSHFGAEGLKIALFAGRGPLSLSLLSRSDRIAATINYPGGERGGGKGRMSLQLTRFVKISLLFFKEENLGMYLSCSRLIGKVGEAFVKIQEAFSICTTTSESLLRYSKY